MGFSGENVVEWINANAENFFLNQNNLLTELVNLKSETKAIQENLVELCTKLQENSEILIKTQNKKSSKTNSLILFLIVLILIVIAIEAVDIIDEKKSRSEKELLFI